MKVKHGTNKGWELGCREKCCTQARHRYHQKVRRGQKSLGTYQNPYTSPDRAVRHLTELWDSYGVPVRKVAQLSGVTPNVLSRWMTGQATKILRENEARVLSVTPEMARSAPGGYQHPAGPVRRLRAMYLRGFDDRWIARTTGLDLKTVWDIRNDTQSRMLVETAEKVKSAYSHSLLLPDPEGRVADDVRSIARKNGYVPAGLWEDIDDPECEPDSRQEPELRDAVLRAQALAVRGFQMQDLAKEAGIAKSNFYRFLYEQSLRARPDTIKRINAVCDKFEPLPDPTGLLAEKTKNLAKKKGWTKNW